MAVEARVVSVECIRRSKKGELLVEVQGSTGLPNRLVTTESLALGQIVQIAIEGDGIVIKRKKVCGQRIDAVLVSAICPLAAPATSDAAPAAASEVAPDGDADLGSAAFAGPAPGSRIEIIVPELRLWSKPGLTPLLEQEVSSLGDVASMSVRDAQGLIKEVKMHPWKTTVVEMEFPLVLTIVVKEAQAAEKAAFAQSKAKGGGAKVGGAKAGGAKASGANRRPKMPTTARGHVRELMVGKDTPHHPIVLREALDSELNQEGQSYGKRLCRYEGTNAAVFNRACRAAELHKSSKTTDVVSKLWSLHHGNGWLALPLNLTPRCQRRNLECLSKVFAYSACPPGTLVVDFANKHVGGGCFGGGFVQEECMVMQSTDFATRLHKHRARLSKTEVCTYEGVHFDVWWPREECVKKEDLDVTAIQDALSPPMTILAADAPMMGHAAGYDFQQLEMFFMKHLLIFGVAEVMDSPLVLTGLLGGGAFRNNRALGLLLHLLMQPVDSRRHVIFHHPIFWSFTKGMSQEDLEGLLLEEADRLLEDVRQSGCKTLGQVLELIYASDLPLSIYDEDLVKPKRLQPS